MKNELKALISKAIENGWETNNFTLKLLKKNLDISLNADNTIIEISALFTIIPVDFLIFNKEEGKIGFLQSLTPNYETLLNDLVLLNSNQRLKKIITNGTTHLVL